MGRRNPTKGTNQIRGWPKPETLYAAVRVQGTLSVSIFFRPIIAATPHPQDVIDHGPTDLSNH